MRIVEAEARAGRRTCLLSPTSPNHQTPALFQMPRDTPDHHHVLVLPRRKAREGSKTEKVLVQGKQERRQRAGFIGGITHKEKEGRRLATQGYKETEA